MLASACIADFANYDTPPGYERGPPREGEKGDAATRCRRRLVWQTKRRSRIQVEDGRAQALFWQPLIAHLKGKPNKRPAR